MYSKVIQLYIYIYVRIYTHMYIYIYIGFSGDSDGKESAHRARPGFNPWVGKIPLRREWLPTPIFSSGEFHGQRSLGELQSMGLQTVRHHWVTSAHTHTHTHTHIFYVWLFVTPWIVAHPGSSVHGISQARILEWFAISFSRGYSQTCSLGVPRPGILHWQADLLCLSHKGSPFHNPGSLLMYFP